MQTIASPHVDKTRTLHSTDATATTVQISARLPIAATLLFAISLCMASLGAMANAGSPTTGEPRQRAQKQWQELQSRDPAVNRWFNARGELSTIARRWIDEFEHADARGLDHNDYRPKPATAAAEATSASELTWQSLSQPIQDTALRDTLARAIDQAALDLSWDLRFGRIEPQQSGWSLATETTRDEADHFAATVLRTTEPSQLLDQLQPPFRLYQRLLEAYRHYAQLARQSLPALPDRPSRVLEPGQYYDGASALAGRLRLLGDLDAAFTDAPIDGQYDATLVAAIMRFQRRHGLTADGRLGPHTWRALNISLDHRAQQLYLSLERWRWLPRVFSQPPIVINIPEFRLRAYAGDGKIVLDMAVQVGAALDRQTPVFAAPLKQVVFHPSWTVPLSILRRDLLAREQAAPGFLVLHDFEIANDPMRPIDADAIELLRLGKLQLRQRPGEGNALGRVKFLLPNSYSVYLHDTPSKAVFDLERRDRSSGCIRLQDPQGLAEWVLREQPEWTPERIAQAMDSGPAEQVVQVLAHIPVYLLYATARVDAEGQVHFFDDIYGQDARLQRALDSRAR